MPPCLRHDARHGLLGPPRPPAPQPPRPRAARPDHEHPQIVSASQFHRSPRQLPGEPGPEI